MPLVEARRDVGGGQRTCCGIRITKDLWSILTIPYYKPLVYNKLLCVIEYTSIILRRLGWLMSHYLTDDV